MATRLTIVIPVYNEGESIRPLISGIMATVHDIRNILVVYDLDTDSTLPFLREMKDRYGECVFALKNKYGRGPLQAIRTGLEAASTEYIIVSMADFSDPPEVMNNLVAKADETGAAVVCASRYMRGGKQIGGPWLKGHLSHLAGWILCHIALLPTHDPTNSFKLYRTSFLRTQTIESTGGFELGLELVVKAYKSGQVVAEIPTTWRDRVAGKSNFKLWKWLPHYLHWFFYAFHHINNGNPLCFTM